MRILIVDDDPMALEMLRHGAAMRRLLARYSERLGRPYLLDLLLPASIPNLHDLARFRFKVEWMRLIETIMNDRRQAPAVSDKAPRDLFAEERDAHPLLAAYGTVFRGGPLYPLVVLAASPRIVTRPSLQLRTGSRSAAARERDAGALDRALCEIIRRHQGRSLARPDAVPPRDAGQHARAGLAEHGVGAVGRGGGGGDGHWES